jgi:hypothetical protein
MIKEGLSFVVRQDGDRHIIMSGGARRAVIKAAQSCKSTIERTIIVEREGYRTEKHIKLGALPVRLPECRDTQLWLVVIRGFGEAPIMLLSSLPPGTRRDYAQWIADLYLTRWKCEEAYRFIKQSYNLEDVRVRSYIALRNTYALVMTVFYFVSVVIGRKTKLSLIFKEVCAKAQRFYEIGNFFHYAIADGIHKLLFAARNRLPAPSPPPNTGQLLFDFAKPPT